ncbi:hypothetical protein ETE48_20430 [Escherichia coli]|nr:hypothetical protein ETE48_20430 [Escherichia coli]
MFTPLPDYAVTHRTWEKGSPLHKSTQQVRTQGPIRHADCRQRKLADFLCTGGIIQGLISVAHQAILHLSSAAVTPTVSG